MKFIFPTAIKNAAEVFADNPKMIGEIVIALVTDRKAKLTDLQRYIIGDCKLELKKLDELREKNRLRKQNQRRSK